MTSDLRDTRVPGAGDWLPITYRGPVRTNRRRIQRPDARSCAAARLRDLWTSDGTAIPTLLAPPPHPASKTKVRPRVTRSLTPPMVGQSYGASGKARARASAGRSGYGAAGCWYEGMIEIDTDAALL